MAKHAAKGAIIQVEISTVLTAIPQSGDFTVDPGEREEIDVTTHDSPGNSREYILGKKNPPDFEIPVIFDSANAVHAYLLAAYNSDSEENFKVIFPDANNAEVTFTGRVKNVPIALGVDAPIQGTILIKPGDMTHNLDPA